VLHGALPDGELFAVEGCLGVSVDKLITGTACTFLHTDRTYSLQAAPNADIHGVN